MYFQETKRRLNMINNTNTPRCQIVSSCCSVGWYVGCGRHCVLASKHYLAALSTLLGGCNSSAPFTVPTKTIGCKLNTPPIHFSHEVNQLSDFAPGFVTQRFQGHRLARSLSTNTEWSGATKKKGWSWSGGGWTLGTSCCWHDTKVWKPGATPNPSWSMKGGSSWLWIWTLIPAS